MEEPENDNVGDEHDSGDDGSDGSDDDDDDVAEDENPVISRSTLAYCWRAMKEVSLIYATLILRAPVENPTPATRDFVAALGSRLKDLAIACRHKGSVELLGTAFETVCRWYVAHLATFRDASSLGVISAEFIFLYCTPFLIQELEVGREDQ
jgi:hypothetical protein